VASLHQAAPAPSRILPTKSSLQVAEYSAHEEELLHQNSLLVAQLEATIEQLQHQDRASQLALSRQLATCKANEAALVAYRASEKALKLQLEKEHQSKVVLQARLDAFKYVKQCQCC